MLVPVSQLGSGPRFYLIFSIKKGRRGQFLNWHKPSRFPFHFIKNYNFPLTSNRVSYIIRSFHIVAPAGFSTFPQHPCGKPEDGNTLKPRGRVWVLLIPHTYYNCARCIWQPCVHLRIKLDAYCLRACDAHILRPDAHILRRGPASPQHIACG